ncbi:unnamed protein product [Lymnaea stagnalis]|uniref:Uncharacterized protein n=1 Tax=Lymnaea stagnalis TaxID=6523 RepID=A0AAV2IQL9_LYMST
MAPTAPEVLLSYQLPSETRGTSGSEERTGWSRGQAGVDVSQSPNGHHQSEPTPGHRCAHFNPAQQRGTNKRGILLEALTDPGSLLINNSTPCPENYTEYPFYTDARASGHDAGTPERFSGVKTPQGRRGQISQRHVKSHPLAAAKIISGRTTIYPFIDVTKAMDYLSNYDTQPRPKRWPLRILLTEAEQRDMERRKNMAKYSAGMAGTRTGSTLVGILGTLTELLLGSLRSTKRLKRQTAFESDQTISAAATLSNSGGESFPTGHAIDPNPNTPDALNMGESMNRIRVTNTPYSVIQKDELSSSVTLANKRVTEDNKTPRRDRKRRKGTKSRGGVDTNCDVAPKNASQSSSVKERHRAKKLNKDGDRHDIVNVKSSSDKPSEDASGSPCDGHRKKRKRKNRFNKIRGKSSTTSRKGSTTTTPKGFTTTTPKGSTTTTPKGSTTTTPKGYSAMTHKESSITAQGSSATSSPVQVTSISRQQLGENPAAETQNTGLFPDKRTTADSTAQISLDSEPLKKTISLTVIHPAQSGKVAEYNGSPKPDGTEVWTPVSVLADNDSDKTRMTNTPPRPDSEWHDHQRQQRRRGSLDTVGVETTTSHTQFHTGFTKPVTQPLPSTNEPVLLTLKEATTSVTKYKSAYDFLSAQQGLRRDTPSNARKEAEAFNLRLATSLCKVFGKRYVPTPIGGKCE